MVQDAIYHLSCQACPARAQAGRGAGADSDSTVPGCRRRCSRDTIGSESGATGTVTVTASHGDRRRLTRRDGQPEPEWRATVTHSMCTV